MKIPNLLRLPILLLLLAGCSFNPLSNEDLAPDFELVFYGEFDDIPTSVAENATIHEIIDQGQPLILNLWGGTCPPCRAEMPEFERFYLDTKDRVTLLGLDVGPFTGFGTRKAGMSLVENMEITYPVATTFDTTIVEKYEVLGVPTTYFISNDRVIRYKHNGTLNYQQLAELVDEIFN